MPKKKSRSRKMSSKIGLPPGALIYLGEKRVENPSLSFYAYNQERVDENTSLSLQQLPAGTEDSKSTEWLNLVGLHEVDWLEKIGKHFHIHSLVLEDILNTSQRPKVEEYSNCLFVVLKAIHYDEKTLELTQEQISFVLTAKILWSVQEIPEDSFNMVRDRIRKGKGKIRVGGADYLLYALVDAVVDQYFSVIEAIGDQIEDIEIELNDKPEGPIAEKISKLRKNLFVLRRSLLPLRDVLRELNRGDFELIQESNLIYYRDVADHLSQVLESIETYREILSASMDLHFSLISNRLNDVMKFLTIFASIFIPLTFIAGIYGMNFEYMPELHWKDGYWFVWGLMLVVAVSMLAYFKKKRWI